jgi:hypothetical protein
MKTLRLVTRVTRDTLFILFLVWAYFTIARNWQESQGVALTEQAQAYKRARLAQEEMNTAHEVVESYMQEIKVATNPPNFDVMTLVAYKGHILKVEEMDIQTNPASDGHRLIRASLYLTPRQIEAELNKIHN